MRFPVTEPCCVRMTVTPTAKVRSFLPTDSQVSTDAIEALTEHYKIHFELAAIDGNAALIEAWGNQVVDQDAKFEIWDLMQPEPRGNVARDSMIVHTSHPAGATQLAVRSYESNSGKKLLAGDLIGVSGRWYRVNQDALFDTNGRAVLRLASGITERIEYGEPVILTRPAITMVMDDDEWLPVFEPLDRLRNVMRVSFSATEAL